MSTPPKPVRVLRLIARLNVGGPARHVVWLNQALAANGFEALLVTGTVPAGEEDMSDFAAARGVTPLVIPSMSRELSPRDFATIWQLWRLMVRFGPNIVHTHTAKAGAVGRIAGLLYRYFTPAALAGRPRRVRFVHTYHGHVFHSYYGFWKTRLFLTVERTLARLNTDRIVVLSEQQLREIRDVFRVGNPDQLANQFIIVPLGIDIDDLRAAQGAGDSLRDELGIDRDEMVVGIVGRVTSIKNHDLFLRVAARARGLARFVVYGDGGDRATLERRATDVIFAGTRDASRIYASLDIVALTSRNEGTPLALIEGMACGKPVISTAVGGVVDLLGRVEERVDENGATFEIRERGITAASDDDAGFAAGLARLLREEPLRRRLAEGGRAYVEKTHSKERLVADILRLYRDLLVQDRGNADQP
ncbi:MAG TPA: glycosyltransferase [Thermoanaerobaculia bacterium]|nr:glycosyltransferase [Thermoanaerobaculia bacterium]